jgi:hypothetical protein
MNSQGADSGLTVMGIDRETNRLIIIVKEDDSTTSWSLTDIQKFLTKEGVEDALAWDGSTSSTLVVNKNVLSDPAGRKDNSIPFGVGFRVPLSKPYHYKVKDDRRGCRVIIDDSVSGY